ncbi:alpha/beta fold hydrolase [Mycolicibacterium sp. CBMA 226]|uniref:alpha/beta fold hydrolase n=1 Tax=Mycolicibacterium sp. CBMA 226 TaxID=2606611 RepID=UPI0012DC0A07|nr:alpha/beta fold hydrolase [Mycolicibacterium sp. CBMA 226]MUL77574.1 alpha/beta fold hydrolase [Mycolicibacterium sp. CBMA 226]
MADQETLDLTLPRLRMRALAWGPADGRLMLCLHGFPDSAHGWRRVAPLLAGAGYRVVAPFMRGYAPSGVPADGNYHVGALVSDVLDLYDALGGGPDAVLVGHDWGAFAANAVAAYPDSPFDSVVSMSVPPLAAMSQTRFGFARTVRMSLIQLRMSWYIMYFQLPGLPERTLHRVVPRLWRDWSPAGTEVSQDVATTLAALPTPEHRVAAVGYYRALVRPGGIGAPYAEFERYLRELPRAPILYLHGTADGAMQVGYAEQLLSALPAGSLVQTIDGAGHFLQVDKPAEVAAAILDYVGN